MNNNIQTLIISLSALLLTSLFCNVVFIKDNIKLSNEIIQKNNTLQEWHNTCQNIPDSIKDIYIYRTIGYDSLELQQLNNPNNLK